MAAAAPAAAEVPAETAEEDAEAEAEEVVEEQPAWMRQHDGADKEERQREENWRREAEFILGPTGRKLLQQKLLDDMLRRVGEVPLAQLVMWPGMVKHGADTVDQWRIAGALRASSKLEVHPQRGSKPPFFVRPGALIARELKVSQRSVDERAAEHEEFMQNLRERPVHRLLERLRDMGFSREQTDEISQGEDSQEVAIDLVDKTWAEKEMFIRFMQFNALHDGLSHSRFGGRCHGLALDWERRRELLLDEIQRVSPHVLCLEELNHFDTFFEERMKELGYEGCYLQKDLEFKRPPLLFQDEGEISLYLPEDPNDIYRKKKKPKKKSKKQIAAEMKAREDLRAQMEADRRKISFKPFEYRGKPLDGCAIFVKSDLLRLGECKAQPFSKLTGVQEDAEIVIAANVELAETGRILCVVSVAQLRAGTSKEDIERRRAQGRAWADLVKRIRGDSDTCVVLCGDMNEELATASPKDASRILCKTLGLGSAYNAGLGEDRPTSFDGPKPACLDYILVPEGYVPYRLWEVPEVTAGSLPSVSYPSHRLALAVELTFR